MDLSPPPAHAGTSTPACRDPWADQAPTGNRTTVCTNYGEQEAQ